MHIGGFLGSPQNYKKNRLLVNRLVLSSKLSAYYWGTVLGGPFWTSTTQTHTHAYCTHLGSLMFLTYVISQILLPVNKHT